METTVYFPEVQTDRKTRLKNWWRRLKLKSALQSIGLLITLMLYTVLGGIVFRKLEYPAEVERNRKFNDTLTLQRLGFTEAIVNNRDNENLTSIIFKELKVHEDFLYGAFVDGRLTHHSDMVTWTTLKAIFFSSTVLTTIGYGNIVPMTTEGRAFCVVFALVGIPLTLTVIADLGKLFASVVSTFIKHIPPLPSKISQNGAATRTTTSLYAVLSVCFLFVYLAAGAGLFVIWEEEWSFFEGFYFCFVTMTTIGFGDLVPKQPIYMLVCTLYILVGLALTSTIIELVRRQYAQSWRQLQALRGPLAENFRKFADNAPGLDVLALQQDLMKVLTVVTMPKRPGSKRDKKVKEKQWEDALEAVIRDMTVNAEPKQPPIVQIVIYESSV